VLDLARGVAVKDDEVVPNTNAVWPREGLPDTLSWRDNSATQRDLVETTPQMSERTRHRRWPVVVPSLLVLGILLWASSSYFLGMFMGARSIPSLQIVNKTDQTISIFYLLPDGTEAMSIEISPHTVADAPITCGKNEIVARTRSGAEVARRGPFPDCNLERWSSPRRARDESVSRPVK